MAAATMVAGFTGPGAAAAHKDRTGATAQGSARPAAEGRTTEVVLITGDTVVVDGSGQVVRIDRGPDRKDVPVHVTRRGDRTLAIPLDAQRLISEGRLDQQLFDVTELSRPEYRSPGGLGLIVRYEGAAKASRTAVTQAVGAAKAGRDLPVLNAQAVRVKDAAAATKVWAALTGTGADAKTDRVSAPGVAKVWLDAKYRSMLERSAVQIGAPAAWQAGFDGRGVKIAVLDTGVDETHPDLTGRQLAERNFSSSPDAVDRHGHGTHVASIAAGTGAASQGRSKGIAHGAGVIDAKVLDDSGIADTSAVVAGIEWATAQGADVVNLSLGRRDGPGVDPVEEAVSRLTRSTGALFVTSAGNAGFEGDSSVTTPGTVEEALTVGSIDEYNFVSAFSGRGPNLTDAGMKPDLVAPGEGIVAAAPGGGYASRTGTSMGTAHAAGAAALLKQKHPTWKAGALKGVLAGAAKDAPNPVFEQGHGQLDVAAALGKTVVAETPTLSFGRQSWPRHDDVPVTKKVTYRNAGSAPVALDLKATGQGPDGKPAPSGFFRLSADRVTVPAGGTASVDVTADTRAGAVDGLYTAVLTATGGGQSVRSLGVVDREVESYDLTVKHVGRNGQPAPRFNTLMAGLTGLGGEKVYDLDHFRFANTHTMRVPKGSYFLTSFMLDGAAQPPADVVHQPYLNVDRDTTVTVDARVTEPVRITPPDPAATSEMASLLTYADVEGKEFRDNWYYDTFDKFRIGHLGPALPRGVTGQGFNSVWTKGPGESYQLAHLVKGRTLPTGFEKDVKKSELTTITAELGSPVTGGTGALEARVRFDNGWRAFGQVAATVPLPGKATVHVNTAGVRWQLTMEDQRPTGWGPSFASGYQRYAAGRDETVRLGVGVFGPSVGAWEDGLPQVSSGAITRNGDVIHGCLPLYADGRARWGELRADTYAIAMHRNGVKTHQATTPLCWNEFTVPADEAEYRLSATYTRNRNTVASTRVSAEWTFTSKRTSAPVDLPVSAVRFEPALALDSTAPAGAAMKVPVVVEGSAAGKRLKSLTVRTSLDDGRTWTDVPVVKGAISVTNPAAGQGIAFQAVAEDVEGNTVTQTIHDAYRGR
ncbi:S8 family serine peptidase [Streptomyces sp. NPDC047315]|uniref:S8 family peptidase n=1 Tax=Streptomyces sp. NPDC047315 TaxID=3155142 RepID=UPI0033E8AAD0